ncbi:MAG: imidazoleglycerol-phosphate dehydratase [Candidatus Omnitrophota bacterium]|nr:imidazoleglycerol-phosphate dehydratase [Candidatus Omnitrophota bacterium]
MKNREFIIARRTNEVDINGKLVIDGTGKTKIKTGFESLDHLLTLFAFHGFFDLELSAKGDLTHHILEDIGIALGDAFKKALGVSSSIKRYGYASVPMDEILAKVSVDLGGRDSFVWHGVAGVVNVKDSLDLNAGELKLFLGSIAKHIKMNLFIEYLSNVGEIDTHHLFEAIFKALGIALDQATQIDPRRKGIPSTKGIID